MRIPILLSAPLVVSAALAQLPTADSLTENTAAQWGAQADGASAAVYNESNPARVKTGVYSVRFETDGGFDTWLWTPVARNANWDLTDIAAIRLWVYAENPSPYGFQNASPWVRLGSSGGYYQYQTSTDLLTAAIGNWLQLTIPLAGDTDWQRTQVGAVSLSDIDYFEFHADTWDYGFKLWLDGLEFRYASGGLPAPTNFQVTPFYSTARVTWTVVNDPSVAGYEIYRRTAAGTYGAPVKRVLIRNHFTDYNLTPGQTYVYKCVAIDGGGLNVSQFTPEVTVTLGTNPNEFSRHKNLEVLVAFYRGGYSQTDVLRMTNGLKQGMEFYWRTTGCRLNFDVTWMYIDRAPPGNDWWNAAVQADLRSRGVQNHQYDLAYLAGQNLAGCYGGYLVFGSTCASLGTTCGVAYPGKASNTDYTIAWTFAHEIHHALELMENITSGTPEVLFCHFPWTYPDPLGPTGWHMDWGPHFDGIAATNREYGDNWWTFPAPYDGYLECVDADRDGLPDSDLRVWRDELRFGSSAATPDTDGDGLSDRAEYSAYNFRGTSPTNPDSDGDGLPDGLDPFPLYVARPSIPRLAAPPVIDGVVEAAWPRLATGYYFTHNTTDFALTTYAGWDADNLYLAVAAGRQLRFALSIDGSGEDGRFESPVRHTSGATDTYNSDNKGNHIGDSWGDGNHIYFAHGLPTAQVWGRGTIPGAVVASTTGGGLYYTELKLPRQLPGGAAYTWYPPNAPVVDGLRLTPGRIIGLNLTASNYSGSDGNEYSGTWTGLFETHSFVDFRLGVPGDLDCSGAVNFDDIDAFVTALSGAAGYFAQYPGCDWLLADLNGDGAVNFDDIDPFVAALGG